MSNNTNIKAALRVEAQQELWRRGILTHKLRPEQRRFKAALDANVVQLFVGNISRRWGKSWTLVTFAIEQCIQQPGIRIRYGAAFQSDLTDYINPAFDKILEDCPKEMKPVYKSSQKLWVFPNGSEIKLVGIDKNPNGIRGNAISIIIIDEAAFVSNLQYLYRSVIIPATAKQANIRIVFISTPPESPEHFFVELINQAKAEGVYTKLTIDDISDMPPEERERLLNGTGGEHSVTSRREWFAEIIVDEERALCPTFNRLLHVSTIAEPSHHRPLVSGDIGGVRDHHCFHLITYDYKQQKYLFLDERWCLRNTPTIEIVTTAKQLEAGRQRITRVIDAPGQIRVDLSATHNYAVQFPEKADMHTGLTFLRNLFYNNQIVIDPKCKMLIATLEGGMLNTQRTDFLRTDTLGHADAVMSAIYGLRHVDRTDPYPPPDFNLIASPAHLKKHKHQLAGLSYANQED
jgi:hypothetical protein